MKQLLSGTKKFSVWIFISIILIILGSISYNATVADSSELFIASAAILALVSWITLISLCVMGVGRIIV